LPAAINLIFLAVARKSPAQTRR